ncbi:F-box/kelch-repeat protein At3g23880-like, partial [Chenopodium quinoa]|uniref:F-box/kelch-repeat protein At3g23880-like n=1 Tax=Chenopodium quinoa TaxID=63459 RepID=UPI000B76C1E5
CGELTLDLIESNILSRLPIKDLFRYQCVCKRWRDEIKNPKFIKSHTFHVVNNHTNSRGSVILFSRSSAKLYSLDFHSPENVKKVIRLSHSFDYDTRLVGSCNGLLCFKLTGWFLIYNPAIQACKTVCVSPFGTKYRMGFGYDCTSDDYKILQTETVNTARCDGHPKQVESHVYSLRNNSWKVVQKPLMVSLSTYSNRMILSNNVLHWIDLDYKPRNNMTTGFIMSKIITCFDLGTEEYHKLPLPNDDNDDGVIISELADSKGYLHLVKYSMIRSSLHKMEIWIMKEYGVEQTWSKLVSIKLDDIIADIVRRQVRKPFLPLLLAYSEDGQEILVDLGQYSEDGMIFVQCDMRSGGFKRLEIQVCDLAADFRDGYVVMPWVGSFVSPSM